MTTDVPGTVAPLRADAARNRDRILCAAAGAFAAGGCEVSLEDVARAAGVGVGTVYRRFPTKQHLLDALFEGRMATLADHVEALADRSGDDPWDAFAELLTALLAEQACDLALGELIRTPEAVSAGFAAERGRAMAAATVVAERARDSGALREGFEHGDLLLALHAGHGVAQAGGPEASARFAAWTLDGFRARA